MTSPWLIGLALNLVIGLAFGAVGIILAVRLSARGEWGKNPLAAAFTLVALTCGAGHLGRGLLLGAPSIGLFEVAGLASRVEFSDWHMWVADGITALAGIFYLVARFRNPEILWTSKLFDDIRERRHRAMIVHDQIVQDLSEARIALLIDEQAQGVQALRRGLLASRRLATGRDPGQAVSEATGHAPAKRGEGGP